MLTQQVIREALIKALSTGADYAEVYAEHTEQKTISLVSAKVDKIADAVISGVGIRISRAQGVLPARHPRWMRLRCSPVRPGWLRRFRACPSMGMWF